MSHYVIEQKFSLFGFGGYKTEESDDVFNISFNKNVY